METKALNAGQVVMFKGDCTHSLPVFTLFEAESVEESFVIPAKSLDIRGKQNILTLKNFLVEVVKEAGWEDER